MFHFGLSALVSVHTALTKRVLGKASFCTSNSVRIIQKETGGLDSHEGRIGGLVQCVQPLVQTHTLGQNFTFSALTLFS